MNEFMPLAKRARTSEMAKQQNAYNYDARKFFAAARAEQQRQPATGAQPVMASAAAAASSSSPAPKKGPTRPKASDQAVRHAGGKTWRDDSLDLWPEGDFRLFAGNLGNEVTDELLAHTFGKYPSLARAKVIRNKHTNKSKGYGFLSFMDPFDCAKALREHNGKYVGNRPCKLTKSTWNERTLKEVRKQDKKSKKQKRSWGIA